MFHLLQSRPLCSWFLQENTVDSIPTTNNELYSTISHILSQYFSVSQYSNDYIIDSRGTAERRVVRLI